jgi:hypothetical protein
MGLQLPVQLDDVIINSQLSLRPSRPPDYRAEIQAIKLLLHTISEAPNIFWQRLAETALQLCQAGTAGVSLLGNQDGAEVFRLEAVAGVLDRRLNSTIPRASPWGAAIERDGPQLMYLPQRFFSALKFDPPIVEALIIPFHVRNKPVGTIWCIAHDDGYKFDGEDERIGRTLASFAAAAWHMRKAWGTGEAAIENDSRSEPVANQTSQAEIIQPRRMQEELQQLTENLETRASEKTADLIAATDHIGLTLERTKNLPNEVQQPKICESTVTGPVEVAAFNSLLNIIQDYATLMKDDLNDPVKLREDIEAISAAVNKSASLVQEIIKDSHKE